MPIKSLPPPKNVAQWQNQEAAMKALQEQVHEQTQSIDASNLIAPVGPVGGSSKGPTGVRKRKASCPVRSL